MSPLPSNFCYFLAIFLLATAGRSSSVESGRLLNEYSGFYDDLAQQLSDAFDETLPRRSVRSAGSETTETSGTINGNILDFVIHRFSQTYATKFRELGAEFAESGEDIAALLKLINHEVGVTIIDIGDSGTASLSATGVLKLAQRYASEVIKKEFAKNVFLQLTVMSFVQENIRKFTPVLQNLFSDNVVKLSDINSLVMGVGSARANRAVDISSSLIELVRVQLRIILVPIQSNIVAFLDTLSEFALSFYVSTEPNNTITKIIITYTNPIVLEAVEVVVNVEKYVNVVFNNILYGNGTSTSERRKREIKVPENDTQLLGFDEFDGAEVKQARALTSVIIAVIRTLLTPLTTWINTLLKTTFINWLSQYYETIGKIVTYPVRYVFQIVVNFIFPCSTCTSIV